MGIQDEHVRRALEDKVQATKAELENMARLKQQEQQLWEEGLMVNDALRYDTTLAKVAERGKNAEFLRQQIEERRLKDKREVAERRAEIGGYFGPEEKQAPGVGQQISHSSTLIKQMEFNQNRRLDSRNRRIVQERKIVDNSLAE